MVNKVTTATVIGLNAYKVEVEIDTNNSLPAISVVGLPDAAAGPRYRYMIAVCSPESIAATNSPRKDDCSP